MNIKKSAIGFAIFFGWYLLARAVDNYTGFSQAVINALPQKKS
jgi:hypothetical protein